MRELNFADVGASDLKESARHFVKHTEATVEFQSGQALIHWHRKKLQTYTARPPEDEKIVHTEENEKLIRMKCLFHRFALGVMPVLLANVKSESTFSRHKRLLGKDRTTTRTAVIDAQCVLQDDPRLKRYFGDVDLRQIADMERWLVATGDTTKQDAKIAEYRKHLADQRRRDNVGPNPSHARAVQQ